MTTECSPQFIEEEKKNKYNELLPHARISHSVQIVQGPIDSILMSVRSQHVEAVLCNYMYNHCLPSS